MSKILIELDDDTLRRIKNLQDLLYDKEGLKISRISIVSAAVKMFLDKHLTN